MVKYETNEEMEYIDQLLSNGSLILQYRRQDDAVIRYF